MLFIFGWRNVICNYNFEIDSLYFDIYIIYNQRCEDKVTYLNYELNETNMLGASIIRDEYFNYLLIIVSWLQ